MQAVARPAWVQRLLGELSASDERAERVARGLNPEQLNWQPQPGRWSVGQCLDHLNATNQQFLPAIAAALRGRHRAVVDKIVLPSFSRWFIRNYVAPNPGGARAPAPKKIRPVQRVDAGILEAFLQCNQRARELVMHAAEYDINRIRFKHPFLPLVRFTAGTGLEIISKHESRHLLQAEGVRSSTGFPR